MRIRTIGSGTGAPSGSRVSSAHLVQTEAVRILFDCGSGAVHRMAALDVDWMGITHVAITHFHADHVSDIPTLLYAWRYGAIPFRTTPATLIGPPSFGEFFDRLNAAFGSNLRELGYELTLVEIEPGSPAELAPGVTLTARKVPHNEESVAYSMEAHGRRIVYTGDTSFDETVAAWAAGCDLLLLECSLPASFGVATHMTPEQCADFAAIARPAALALTHFYPPVEAMDVRATIAQKYSGPVHLTYDGWTHETER